MSYDYVIVGAGSAGAALAARLSEDPATSVLLLEAGPDLRTADVPEAMRIANASGLQRQPEFARFRWDGLVARRTSAQLPRPYNRGRVLGGSSAVNGLVAIRGIPEDFDWWAAEGCAGWAWADVLPAFIRLEDDLNFGDAAYHGRGGPIPVWRAPLSDWGAVDLALRSAALGLGYPWADNHNAPDSTGVSTFAVNSRAGRRVSTADGYLDSIRARPNLTIQADSLVDRVLIEDGRAVGLRVRQAGVWREIAGRRIVLCAGAIGSPAILLRSGIGPAASLGDLAIPVVRDAPVGLNLLDHVAVSLHLDLRPAARAASPAARTTTCCVRYSSGLAGAGANDMLIRGWNLDGDEVRHLGRGHVMVSAYQCFSRGHLRLVSRDPETFPAIELDLLSDERDRCRMRDGLRRLVALLAHPAFAAIAETVEAPLTAAGAPVDLGDDGAVDAWLLDHAHDVAHISGTCRMGALNDPRSVVDPDAHVIGVAGLSVVDAAIMPEIPRANLHLSVVMLGEHVAARWRAGAGG